MRAACVQEPSDSEAKCWLRLFRVGVLLGVPQLAQARIARERKLSWSNSANGEICLSHGHRQACPNFKLASLDNLHFS